MNLQKNLGIRILYPIKNSKMPAENFKREREVYDHQVAADVSAQIKKENRVVRAVKDKLDYLFVKCGTTGIFIMLSELQPSHMIVTTKDMNVPPNVVSSVVDILRTKLLLSPVNVLSGPVEQRPVGELGPVNNVLYFNIL